MNTSKPPMGLRVVARMAPDQMCECVLLIDRHTVNPINMIYLLVITKQYHT